MPYFTATVKLLIEDDDIEHARTTTKLAMESLKEDMVVLDWGYCSDIPSNKGPFPRLVSPDLGSAYEECMTAIEDEKNEETKAELKFKNEELFKRL